MASARVFIVDDEPAMLANCERLLALEGYTCHALADPTRFRTALGEVQPDVLLLDLRMPGADGMTVLAAALADDPGLPVIMMTAYATVASAVQAIREGAFDYLTKPFTADQLIVAVERAVRYRSLTAENRALRELVTRDVAFEHIVGASPPMLRLLDQVRKVAPSDANVLISGESGTGKELIARAIHLHSTRRKGPFVPVDCAALPETLLESELFGYERGAFTGAVTRKEGLLLEGDGGTLFLDEITELGAGLQSKLLRTLEERKVRRLGGTSLIEVNTRVLAATNLDPEAALSTGKFRPDLYYRLNVVHLRVPPLRARQDDIALLLHTFAAEFAEAFSKPVPRFSPDALQALETYRWPGNVRELRNLAQRLVLLDEDGRVTLADLPDAVRGWTEGEPDAPPLRFVPYEEARAQALAAFRSAYVKRLLAQHDGNVSQAARQAGLSRRTLHRWLAEGATTNTTERPR
ncbi:MAG: sigma-54-dependent Fis family transcriptional regulator [Gemmatimonadetes bacterium]|nr:sigma-54-dependent Fis family transcriptional regulator [Gemmatimonadota bacterium]